MDVVPAAAEVREDNTVVGMGGYGWAIGQGALAGAWRTLVRGAPAGRRALSAPADGAFRLWARPLQAGLFVAALSTIVVGASETEWLWRVGLFFDLLAVGWVFTGVVLALAVEATVPPPRRPMRPKAEDPLAPHDAESGLVAVADGVWVAQQGLRFYGARLGARMVVLDTGAGLILYSPIAVEPALLEAVLALGVPRWIVSPNPLHHLFVRGWHEALPEASLWAAPGLPARRPDLPWAGTLDGSNTPWDASVVASRLLDGNPFHREVVLGHLPSATLVVADMIMNLGQDPSTLAWWQRSVFHWSGMVARPGPPVEWKLTVTEPALLRAGVRQVSQWPIERIVPAHGPLVEHDAHAVFADAFAFVA